MNKDGGGKVKPQRISGAGAAVGDALTWDGTRWKPGAAAGGGGASGRITYTYTYNIPTVGSLTTNTATPVVSNADGDHGTSISGSGAGAFHVYSGAGIWLVNIRHSGLMSNGAGGNVHELSLAGDTAVGPVTQAWIEQSSGEYLRFSKTGIRIQTAGDSGASRAIGVQTTASINTFANFFGGSTITFVYDIVRYPGGGASGGAGLYVGPSAPPDPVATPFWYDTDDTC